MEWCTWITVHEAVVILFLRASAVWKCAINQRDSFPYLPISLVAVSVTFLGAAMRMQSRDRREALSFVYALFLVQTLGQYYCIHLVIVISSYELRQETK